MCGMRWSVWRSELSVRRAISNPVKCFQATCSGMMHRWTHGDDTRIRSMRVVGAPPVSHPSIPLAIMRSRIRWQTPDIERGIASLDDYGADARFYFGAEE